MKTRDKANAAPTAELSDPRAHRVEEDLCRWRRELLSTLRSDVGEDEVRVEGAGAAAQRLEVLSFGLGTEDYGVEIGEVAEILLPRVVTPLPRTPEHIRGVVSLRGTVLPVVDLARHLGLRPGERTRSSRILVLRDDDERMGFWVDRVNGVVRFAKEDVETTEFASAVDSRFLKGIGYDRKGNLISVLSGEKLCAFGLEEGR